MVLARNRVTTPTKAELESSIAYKHGKVLNKYLPV
jgi:hypothetical protein